MQFNIIVPARRCSVMGWADNHTRPGLVDVELTIEFFLWLQVPAAKVSEKGYQSANYLGHCPWLNYWGTCPRAAEVYACEQSCSTSSPVSTGMGDRSPVPVYTVLVVGS